MDVSGQHVIAKPKLLIILHRFVVGGQAIDAIPLAYFLKDSFDIHILYGPKEPDEVEPTFLLDQYPGLTLQKVKELRRNINPFWDLLALFRLVRIIRNFKPQIVHTHGAKSGFIGRLAAWFAGVPIIVHTFHGHFFHSYFSKGLSRVIAFVERQLGKITTAVIALSQSQKNDLSTKFSVLPASKIQIIPLGFYLDESHDSQTARSRFRSRFGLTEPDIAIGIIGRIVPIKNHYFFLKVIENLLQNRKLKNIAFFIVGDGEISGSLQAELTQKQIHYSHEKISEGVRVVFTSWIMDTYELMSGLDIIALTSLNEGTPFSLIEAQFFGKPIVATNVGGVGDTIEDKKSGFLVEVGDLDGFSEKLELLISEKSLRTTMAESGRQVAKKRFSKVAEVNATKEFYFSLLNTKGLDKTFRSE